jgi:erythromycin esterase-like protein
MPEPEDDLVSSLSELAVPFPNTSGLTATDLPATCHARFDDATVIGLGEASHGTQEFFELRLQLTRLLGAEFGVRAVGFEAEFDPLCRSTTSTRSHSSESGSGRDTATRHLGWPSRRRQPRSLPAIGS